VLSLCTDSLASQTGFYQSKQLIEIQLRNRGLGVLGALLFQTSLSLIPLQTRTPFGIEAEIVVCHENESMTYHGACGKLFNWDRSTPIKIKALG